LLQDFFIGLLHGSVVFWAVALGPAVFILLLRLFVRRLRRRPWERRRSRGTPGFISASRPRRPRRTSPPWRHALRSASRGRASPRRGSTRGSPETARPAR